MSVRSRPVSVRSSQSAASSLALNAAQAIADLAVAKARAEFNRRKAEANRARIEAEVEMDRLQIEEAVAAALSYTHLYIGNGVAAATNKKGYAEAKRILKEEFGQAHVIAKAHLSMVLNRPQVRPNDGKGLWNLARDMRRCQTVLSQMCYSADMNSSESLLRIQQLLPIHLQTKWAKKAYAMMEKLITPDFKCMSSFVEEAAKLANNMYGQNIGGSYPKNTPKWKPNSKGITSLTTTTRRPEVSLTTETTLTCPACLGSHILEKCRDFIRYSHEERLKILRKERLCDNCFGASHIARRCSKPLQCEQGCKWKHHTLLHRTDEERKDTAKTTTVGLTGAGDCGLATIVPVKVKAKDSGVILNTYDLLDEGSNSSFCTIELCRRLKTSSKLPDVDTLEVIPASKNDIMKPKDLRNWPYLDRVKLKHIDAEIGSILIGSNVPKDWSRLK
ncbi:uncharacterized protein LOC117108203 [Anneissia japonica]|uniref:uncharacterized protein LOC117108203 n=1 Tax=Anneissia japonica TaxID=1529436 RepID=UPI0014259FCB|nr:uncharacterized protein LOC117108203 [Anneissia japonica]